MEELEKITKLSKKLNIYKSRNTFSQYGYSNNTNIRISNHLPKFNHLQDYLATLTINEDDSINFLFIIITDENIKIDEYEWVEETEEWFEDYTDKKTNVIIEIFYNESLEVIEINVEKLLRNI